MNSSFFFFLSLLRVSKGNSSGERRPQLVECSLADLQLLILSMWVVRERLYRLLLVGLHTGSGQLEAGPRFIQGKASNRNV